MKGFAMFGRKYTRRAAAVLGVSAFLAGCVGLGGWQSSGPDSGRPRPGPAAQQPAPASDLRIPASAVAQGPEIPLVPVPPPPVGREAPPQPTTPPAPPPAAPAESAGLPAGSAGRGPPAVPPQTPPHTARQILQAAAARYATMDSYIARLTRRDQLKDRNQPEELLLFKFRKEPWSVHLKWLGEVGRGREVVYVKGQYDNKIHTLLAAGDAPLMSAGKRFAIAPDSVFARTASRHSITEAGVGFCLEALTAQLDAQEHGDQTRGSLAAIAPQRRPEYPQPVEALERILPPGVDPDLPRGGRRLICIDPDWQLPLLIITYDDKGQQVEYYLYDRLQAPVRLDDDDFNPDKLFAPKNLPPLAEPGAK
jgi:Protein of unknown function (DUF1571)